ncbi:MAG: type II toxin-antitoxin system RelB/DinJ family antitoxin [Catonella sp.]|nr:type II toxin-antitoxin system RelB/DinJ family antitoxin [Catonella sp.]MDY6357839.1 type II toxin-antitoxin system RelB/DinJ family antitoxin [Catonella sp.]
MAQVNFRVDQDLKWEAEKICSEMGLTLSTAITVYLRAIVKQKKIPFEISADSTLAKENVIENVVE